MYQCRLFPCRSTGPYRSLLQHRPPMELQPLSGIPAWLNIFFMIGCRPISALAPGASSDPSPSLTLVAEKLSLSHILTPFSRLLLFDTGSTCCYVCPISAHTPHTHFPHFLNMLLQRCYHQLLASGGSILELDGSGSIWHRASF